MNEKIFTVFVRVDIGKSETRIDQNDKVFSRIT